MNQSITINRNTKLRVIGIDPGIKNLGWGVVEGERMNLQHIDSGVFHPTDDDLGKKLLEIHNYMLELIDRFQPELVSIESVFVDKNPRNTQRLGEVRAAVILAAASKNIPFIDFAPRKVKMRLTGSGDATKAKVADMVNRILKLHEEKLRFDRFDALAIALCGLWERQTTIKIS